MTDHPRAISLTSGLGALIPGIVCLFAIGHGGFLSERDAASLGYLLLAGFSGSLALSLSARMLLGVLPSIPEILRHALLLGLICLPVDPAMGVWHRPRVWHEFLHLSPLGAQLAGALYIGVTLWRLARRAQHPPLRVTLSVLLLPLLANLLLGLEADELMQQLGGALPLAGGLSPGLQGALARGLALALFNISLFAGGRLLMDNRWTRDARLLGLLAFSAFHAALSPLLADMVSGACITTLPLTLQITAVAVGEGLAQAGLWAQTFLVSGMLMEALHRRKPAFYAASLHWRKGLEKGFMFGVLFMLLAHVYGLARHSPDLLLIIEFSPGLAMAAGGAALFCLARTIMESFDLSRPFLARLLENLRMPMNHLRGVLLGAGLFGVEMFGVQHAGVGARFAYGLLIGALIYGGGDLIHDGFAVLRARRQRLQTWRLYALGAGIGGAVGGAIAWYFDPAQIAVVTSRLEAYAMLHFPAYGKAAADYVIYPLFSRWGEMHLGVVEGGARLLYNDSLSGVINWSIAAPLFSINLVALTALFERSLNPLRRLFSVNGLIGIVEQAVRVLRWGLWMAPIIQTFLRMSPDANWYNQDGAIRTVIATLSSLIMQPGDFRQWSLDVFLGLLAYEWLRILIWFDHMGLRVASLVNLSFVGGDRFDEWAARFIGHRARTRILPEGVRRFATWAPLLIPFFIPRGRDWDYVWAGAEHLAQSGEGPSPAISLLLAGYGGAAMAAIAIGAFSLRGAAGSRLLAGPFSIRRPHVFTMNNGVYSLEGDVRGRSFARAFSPIRKGDEIDLTRRPQDPHEVRGKFFYIHEQGRNGESAGPLWSIGAAPVGLTGPDYGLQRPTPASACWTNSHDGIEAQAFVELAPDAPIERWRVRLKNHSQRPRIVLLTSYQEWALNGLYGYTRNTDYNSIHIATCFVRPLGAVMARNRLLRSVNGRSSREIAFHATHIDPERLGNIALLGYEDSRAHFIGCGTLRAPDALTGGRLRAIDDEGVLYTFDPAASLQLRVEIPPGGEIVIPFTDGFARDEYEAARYLADERGRPPLEKAGLDAVFQRKRQLLPPHVRQKQEPLPFCFSGDGRELRVDCCTRRPLAHVLANPLGSGAIISNDGAMFSFAGNAQQNGITPFCLDSVPTQSPAQIIYVQDCETGELDSPCFAPYRRKDARHHAVYGAGYAEFHKSIPGRDYALTVFLPADQKVELRLLTIRNTSDAPQRLRIASYMEIALAELTRDSLDHLEMAADESLGALYFRNPRNDFHQGWAFAASSLKLTAMETVKQHFLGGEGYDAASPFMLVHGHGDLSQPDDGRRIALLMGEVEIPAHEETAIVIMLGQTATREEADALIRQYRDPAAVPAALASVKAWWREKLSVLQVETSMPEFDRMVNHWLPYQVLTARLWGRAGPNQRSGAYGYRDQLQDVLPLIFTHPEIARRQILLHAAQQFREGDVLKWWHQAAAGGSGLGQRTTAGDPHLWLVYLVNQFVRATGNDAILNEQVAFLEGESLPRGAQSRLMAPRPSRDSGTVYDHCKRAIDLTLSRMGANGLPLIGASDWNDGFDEAGLKGRGESVWLGFFLHDALLGFADLAARKEGAAMRDHYLRRAESLRHSLDRMWRGDRYVRLISDAGEEMAILDALSAAWPVISGVADLARGRIALEAALAKLELGDLILLLDSPFDSASHPYPGRIADYPPGVRENGGQYSHGVSWLVDALSRLAEMAQSSGNPLLAQQFRARAAEIWLKISPLDNLSPGRWEIYGLAPHQQPADVYYGEGYEGRGGWSWYSGAAARMMYAAYSLLGIRMQDGRITLENAPAAPASPLHLRRVFYRGREITPGKP
ncbi:MAG: GH36-type glycosyl hydrolase domain-containing protein [Pseudomonadota bacterium]